jgi:hypothetical protein
MKLNKVKCLKKKKKNNKKLKRMLITALPASKAMGLE